MYVSCKDVAASGIYGLNFCADREQLSLWYGFQTKLYASVKIEEDQRYDIPRVGRGENDMTTAPPLLLVSRCQQSQRPYAHPCASYKHYCSREVREYI